MQSLLQGLAWVLSQLFYLYTIVMVVGMILSLANAPANGFTSFVRALTEPVYVRVRRRLPFVVVGGWDLSPLVVYFVIKFLDFALIQNLYRLADKFR